MKEIEIDKGDFIIYEGRCLHAEFEDRPGYWWCSDNDGEDYYVETKQIVANVTACMEH